MNIGLDIFSRAQRLQGGTGGLNYDPSDPRDVPTTGFGSDKPTQRAVGFIGNFLGNLAFPGLGMLTGPAASKIYQMIRNGASQSAVQAAVAAYQTGGSGGTDTSGGDTTTAPQDTTTAPQDSTTAPHAGVGIDPWGNPADPGEWWSNDFNRWNTDEFGTTPGNYNLLGPGGQFGTRGLGSSGFGGTVGNFGTAIGFGGPYGGGISAGDTSRFRGQAGFSHPYTETQYNTSPSHFGWEGGPGYQGIQGGQPRASYEQYLEMFHAPGTIGSSTGPGGAAAGGIGAPQGGVKSSIAHTPRRAAFAMGTSDVNQGLYFYRKQLKKPKL